MTSTLYAPAPGTTPLSLHIDSDPPVDATAVLVGGVWTFTYTAPTDGTYTRQVLVQRDDVPGAAGQYEDTGTIRFVGGQVESRPSWTPLADRVAGLIPNRTQPTNGSGVALGTFTTGTRPTAEQVNELCGVTAREVEAATGGLTLPADLFDSAADVATLGAAARVELAFYRDSDSRYDELRTLYDDALGRLVQAVVARRDAESIPGGGSADLPPSPRGSFPAPMTIRDERW